MATTAVRSFSALRRLKTYLRSSMSEERLNNLLLLYVGDLFASANSRRQEFCGKFV